MFMWVTLSFVYVPDIYEIFVTPHGMSKVPFSKRKLYLLEGILKRSTAV